VLELGELSKLLFGVLDSLVNELASELEAGLDSGLNAHDWVNSVTEGSCFTLLLHHQVCLNQHHIILSLVTLNKFKYLDCYFDNTNITTTKSTLVFWCSFTHTNNISIFNTSITANKNNRNKANTDLNIVSSKLLCVERSSCNVAT
jgi:hypothetical protein